MVFGFQFLLPPVAAITSLQETPPVARRSLHRIKPRDISWRVGRDVLLRQKLDRHHLLPFLRDDVVRRSRCEAV